MRDFEMVLNAEHLPKRHFMSFKLLHALKSDTPATRA
jgi:hypothetical protein